jgi:hypothetical protein
MSAIKVRAVIVSPSLLPSFVLDLLAVPGFPPASFGSGAPLRRAAVVTSAEYTFA